jgi:hypothetical protein
MILRSAEQIEQHLDICGWLHGGIDNGDQPEAAVNFAQEMYDSISLSLHPKIF